MNAFIYNPSKERPYWEVVCKKPEDTEVNADAIASGKLICLMNATKISMRGNIIIEGNRLLARFFPLNTPCNNDDFFEYSYYATEKEASEALMIFDPYDPNVKYEKITEKFGIFWLKTRTFWRINNFTPKILREAPRTRIVLGKLNTMIITPQE